MPRSPAFAWQAYEYAYDEKTAEWYWALGVIAVAAAIASALFGNYLLAAVIASGAVATGLQAAKEPREHFFQLSEQGLSIGNRLYPFDLMHSFSVFEYIDESIAPVLSIKTHSLLSPHLMIPLEGVDADAVYAFLFAYIEEGAHADTLVDRLIEQLGL
ncbi:MAG: hypothetical protein B7X04_03650 [Parcubacteria group bacterium 21-54-25]|nr:MAG: hypothetical protein B7X04_03650 [Parcubacteria group bacterium 21-54-25]HQU08288.1 hypothetical protein [Candidatus Paceibacterota bacterium]